MNRCGWEQGLPFAVRASQDLSKEQRLFSEQLGLGSCWSEAHLQGDVGLGPDLGGG